MIFVTAWATDAGHLDGDAIIVSLVTINTAFVRHGRAADDHHVSVVPLIVPSDTFGAGQCTSSAFRAPADIAAAVEPRATTDCRWR